MYILIIVSIIWSASFSLIKGNLTGIDPILIAFLRLLISFIVFIPFFRFSRLNLKLNINLILIGVFQYGLMYLCYIYSYQYLQAYEIAILTIFTPIFIVITFDLLSKKFIPINWIKAILAILGAGIILISDSTRIGFWKGIMLMQTSNILFAVGQIYYKRIVKSDSFKEQLSYFPMVYLGSVLITGVFVIFSTDISTISIDQSQWLVIVYLGLVASGLGFFLWNYGATMVNTGSLAVLNNLKIPLGVLFAFVFLGEDINLIQLIGGGSILMIALIISEKSIKQSVE